MIRRRSQFVHQVFIPRTRMRYAFTLIELTVALAISSMLLIAIGGAVSIASQALPVGGDVNHEHSQAAAVSRDIVADIRYASAFSELTSSAITFTVADRDGDGNDDTIRYQCLGTADTPAPLTRSINGGAATTLLDDVHGFNFDFGTYEITEPGPLVFAEGDEALLIDQSDLTDSTKVDIQLTSWVGTRFNLNMANENATWRLTKVKLMLELQGNSNGVVKVQLRTADINGLPTTDVIDEVTFLETDASSAALSQLNFSNATGLSPNTDYCIVVVYESGNSPVMTVKVTNVSSGSPNTSLVETFTGEGSWQERSTADVVFQVFGHVTGYNSSPATVSKTRLRWIGLTMAPNEDAQTQVTIQSQVLAQPEVTP